MRRLAVLAAAALPACSSQAGDDAAHGAPVSCALGGAQTFKPDCRIERAAIDGASLIVVRHPDGGFRRLELSKDGRNLRAADGADASRSVLKDDHFEVTLGPDRYLIPVEGHGAAH